MTTYLKPEPGEGDVRFVAQLLRARDREEIFATQWTDTPDELVRNVMASGSFRWGAYIDGIPIGMIGAVPTRPRVWTAWAFGTNDFKHGIRTITRHVRDRMIPALLDTGALRVDATALASHDDARRWLVRLGATPGLPLANYGKDGQTFVTYTWLRQDFAAPAPAVPEPRN